MKELIKISESKTVSARELHTWLGASERFANWIERQFQYGFIENQDFTSVKSLTLVNNGAKREIEDFALTIDCAKQISMVQKSDKGSQARQYFIDCEKALLQRSKEPLLNTKIHLQRYELNKPNIPKEYFCMLKEVITEVIMELELEGKDLIDSAMPDGSLGIGFPKFLKEKGIDISGYPKYRQQLTNGKIIDARAYPYTVYHFFKEFVDIWIKDKGQKYFTEKTILLLNK